MRMKKRMTGIAVCLLALVSPYVVVQAGDLEPPGSPAPTMVTLQELFDKLTSLQRPGDTCFGNTGDRFVDCLNGTIKDTETGLYWLKNASCFQKNWADANIKAAELAHGQCGLTDGSVPGDWRLPTAECPSDSSCSLTDATGEFASIFAPSCPSPFIPDTAGTGCWSEGNPFSGVQSPYWSATTRASGPHLAWAANLSSGAVTFATKTVPNLVWPVRGGQ